MRDFKPTGKGLFALILASLIPATAVVAQNTTIRVVDKNGDRLPCRIHLSDDDGKPVQPANLPFWKDHFVCDGEAQLTLAPGEFTYSIERGPEYTRATGTIEKTEDDLSLEPVILRRHTALPAKGWFGGDLHVHRAIGDLPLLMRAEDLHIAPVITWWRDKNLWRERPRPRNTLVPLEGNRFFHVMGGEDEREGGALLFFNLAEPMDITGSTREYPSPMKFLNRARGIDGAWIDIEKPFWWDVPVWLASGRADSIGIANNHMCHSQMYESEAWGKPRDESRLPAPRGNGFWTQEIYYHILNSGIRIPPSAGSASGVLPNPLGYNRVYVHTGEKELSYENWWAGLKAGRSFVTNGPILLVEANGQKPGHVFKSKTSPKTFFLEISLTSLDPVSAIEVIRDGAIVETIPIEWTGSGIPIEKSAELEFPVSGWFLIRAVTDLEHTFRFASTAPFYVEISDDPRHISRKSTRFFIDWIEERTQRIPEKLKDPDKLKEVLAFQEEALRWWQERHGRANAE